MCITYEAKNAQKRMFTSGMALADLVFYNPSPHTPTSKDDGYSYRLLGTILRLFRRLGEAKLQSVEGVSSPERV